MTTTETIAITGATGHLGRLVIANLLTLAPAVRVIGLVRNAAASFTRGRRMSKVSAL